MINLNYRSILQYFIFQVHIIVIHQNEYVKLFSYMEDYNMMDLIINIIH